MEVTGACQSTAGFSRSRWLGLPSSRTLSGPTSSPERARKALLSVVVASKGRGSGEGGDALPALILGLALAGGRGWRMREIERRQGRCGPP